MHCSVPAELPHKNSSVPAEIPQKTLPSRPRYLVSFPLHCSYTVNIVVLKCIIMTKHLLLTHYSPPFVPPNFRTFSLRIFSVDNYRLLNYGKRDCTGRDALGGVSFENCMVCVCAFLHILCKARPHVSFEYISIPSQPPVCFSYK